MQLGIELVDDDGAAALERGEQEGGEAHELLRAGRLLAQAQLVLAAVDDVPHEDALAPAAVGFLDPEPVDVHVDGPQEARDLGRVALLEHLLEGPSR